MFGQISLHWSSILQVVALYQGEAFEVAKALLVSLFDLC
jgi:hypothetical protein